MQLLIKRGAGWLDIFAASFAGDESGRGKRLDRRPGPRARATVPPRSSAPRFPQYAGIAVRLEAGASLRRLCRA